MPSREFEILKKRSKVLKKRFINNQVRSNPLTDRSQDMLRTFRILMHAEIEFYLEQIIVNKVKFSLNNWKNTKKIQTPLLSLLAYTEDKFPNVSSRLSEVTNKNDLNYRINTVVQNFIRKVERHNNGIKEKDIVPLLIPLGVDANQINQTLLNNLSSYGKFRGDVAHNSYKVTTKINPSDEEQIIHHILLDLIILDEEIKNLK